jgi:HK97 family phage prohead protease
MKRLFREKIKNGDDLANAVVVKAVDTIITDEGNDRTLKFVISNEAEDSYKDVVSSDGWDLSRFKKNPVVLWAHDHRQPPVAKAVSIGIEGKNLVAEAKFADAETYAFADTIFKLVKGGFIKATSVGFFPKEWNYDEERGGYNLLKNELYEFSIVPVPANPEALQLAVKSGIDIGPLRTWAEELLTAPVGDQDPSPVLKEVDVAGILKSIEDLDFVESVPVPSISDDLVERTTEALVAALARKIDKEVTDPIDDDDDEDSEIEKFIDDLPDTVMSMSDDIENLKAQVDQLLAKIAADEEARKQEDQKTAQNDLFDVIDITFDSEEADEVSRSILDLEIEPAELQALIRRELENQFMKQTGRLPKEV